jgi:hypothetical protein
MSFRRARALGAMLKEVSILRKFQLKDVSKRRGL